MRKMIFVIVGIALPFVCVSFLFSDLAFAKFQTEMMIVKDAEYELFASDGVVYKINKKTGDTLALVVYNNGAYFVPIPETTGALETEEGRKNFMEQVKSAAQFISREREREILSRSVRIGS